jgi:hypothetical protein
MMAAQPSIVPTHGKIASACRGGSPGTASTRLYLPGDRTRTLSIGSRRASTAIYIKTRALNVVGQLDHLLVAQWEVGNHETSGTFNYNPATREGRRTRVRIPM